MGVEDSCSGSGALDVVVKNDTRSDAKKSIVVLCGVGVEYVEL
jgi:hypothetical protein